MEFAVAGVTLNPLIPFLWALFVGLVFSMVGAAGGILAGVGHISLFGLADANMIKPMNQLLVIVSPLVAVPAYWRQQRVIFSLGLLLGLGSVFGSVFGSWYSKNYLSMMQQYRPLFGLLVLFISCRLFYESSIHRAQQQKRDLRDASRDLEKKLSELRGRAKTEPFEKILKSRVTFRRLEILFLDHEFSCNLASPVLTGFSIAAISSALGVGGGFLLVPYMTSWLGLPMFLVAGTSALSVLIASISSVGSYFFLGVKVDWLMVLLELLGVVTGSLLGPWISRYMKDRWLRGLLAIVLLYLGIGYALGGWIREWLGFSII